jgi:amino acid transporter
MGMPPAHTYYGSDPGDKDPRFGSGGGGHSTQDNTLIFLGIVAFVAFIVGLILIKVYAPVWVISIIGLFAILILVLGLVGVSVWLKRSKT